MKKWLRLLGVFVVSVYILISLPFPEHNTTADLMYIVDSAIDMWKDGG